MTKNFEIIYNTGTHEVECIKVGKEVNHIEIEFEIINN